MFIFYYTVLGHDVNNWIGWKGSSDYDNYFPWKNE